MTGRKDRFFSSGELREYLSKLKGQMIAEVDAYSLDALSMDTEGIIQKLEAKYRLESPVLMLDEIAIDQNGEEKIDVSKDPMRLIRDHTRPFYIAGTFVEIIIPFKGKTELFNYQPSQSYTSGAPTGKVEPNQLRIRYTRVDQDGEALRREIDQDLKMIQDCLNFAASDLNQYNNEIKQTIPSHIEERKQKLSKDRSMINGLGIPLKKRDNPPGSFSVPVTRHPSPLQMVPQKTNNKAEPYIEMAVYEDILRTINAMGQVIELTPKSFSGMGEESIRFIFLVPLNVQYEGQATGETFNYEGKTDILIKVNGKNAFIAECKIWGGEKLLHETIDQLLGYLSWRDTKTAILLFNRNKNLSSVLNQIPDIVTKHPNCIRHVTSYKHETGFRFMMRQRDDPEREMLLTVYVFDVPV